MSCSQFVVVGQSSVQLCDPFKKHLYSCNDDPQAVPTSNGTSFEFVTTENGPVCLDLYSTPQYKMDQPNEGTGGHFKNCRKLITFLILLFRYKRFIDLELIKRQFLKDTRSPSLF